MKRPQFSLRLMMLVVALAATIIGWRVAVARLRQVDRDGERANLILLLKFAGKDEASIDDELQTYEGRQTTDSAARISELLQWKPRVKQSIADIKKKIDEIDKLSR